MKTSITIVFISFILMLTSLISACKKEENVIRIGIIIPTQHAAFDEMIAGFENQIKTSYSQPVEFKVANAQNDKNLMQAMIQQMRDEDFKIVAPISTTTTQMTLSVIKDKPVIGMSAMYSEEDRKIRQSCNVVCVNDELSVDLQMAFIHKLYPNLKTITLIHSSSEKVFANVKNADLAARKYGITIHQIMMQNLQELYTMANSLPDNTEAIFVLKDAEVISGINTLVKLANDRKIPLITSDDGSVKNGALFALGVHESQIGEESAKLAIKILNGSNVCSLPIVKLTKPIVFVNKNKFIADKIYATQIKKTANELGYPLEIIP